MGDTCASAHQLDLVGLQLAAISHAVLVGDGSGDDVAENFHFPMRVSGETCAWGDDVLVDDAQAAEAHVGGIVVISETEGVIGIQPTVIGVAAFGRSSDCEWFRFHNDVRMLLDANFG